MKGSICESMKKAVIISTLFIVVGVMLEVTTGLFNSVSLMSIILAYLGFFAIWIGFFIISITGSVVLLPKINKKLEACQH